MRRFGSCGRVPVHSFYPRLSLPSAGSSGSLPLLHRYYEKLRLLAVRRAAFVVLSQRYRAAFDGSLACDSNARRTRLETFGSGSPQDRIVASETARSPKFLQDPSARSPCSQTPVGLACQAISTRSYCLVSLNSLGSHGYGLSGLNHTAFALAVYASRGAVARTPRKTRFRWMANPCRTGLESRRVSNEVSRHVMTILHAQALLGAIKDSMSPERHW